MDRALKLSETLLKAFLKVLRWVKVCSYKPWQLPSWQLCRLPSCLIYCPSRENLPASAPHPKVIFDKKDPGSTLQGGQNSVAQGRNKKQSGRWDVSSSAGARRWGSQLCCAASLEAGFCLFWWQKGLSMSQKSRARAGPAATTAQPQQKPERVYSQGEDSALGTTPSQAGRGGTIAMPPPGGQPQDNTPTIRALQLPQTPNPTQHLPQPPSAGCTAPQQEQLSGASLPRCKTAALAFTASPWSLAQELPGAPLRGTIVGGWPISCKPPSPHKRCGSSPSHARRSQKTMNTLLTLGSGLFMYFSVTILRISSPSVTQTRYFTQSMRTLYLN